jgi:tetratricopeptide (TPR) repeat protein
LELAAAYKRIADVQGNPALSGLGQTPAAIASYEKARAVLNRLAATTDPSPQVLSDLANLERTMGFMYLNSGDPSRALEHLRKSIAAWERRHPQRNQDLESDTGIAQAWGIMGQALAAQGESAAAVQSHTAAVDLLRGWLPRKIAPTTLGTVSIMLQHLGDALRETGDLTGAVRIYREAVQIRKQILQENPTSLSYRRRLFNLNFALASVLGNPLAFSLGNPADAETYAAETLREAQAMAKEDRGSVRAGRDLMFGNWIMGCVLLPTDPRRALPYLETALALVSARRSVNPDDVLHTQSKANAEEALARALLLTGDRRRAIDLLRRASNALEHLWRSNPQMADYRLDLIRVWNTLGDTLPAPAAHEFYRQAYLAAQSASLGDRNAWDQFSRANVNLRWPRWNPHAPETERRRMFELALQSLQKLSAQAPENASLQAALAEAQRGLRNQQPTR